MASVFNFRNKKLEPLWKKRNCIYACPVCGLHVHRKDASQHAWKAHNVLVYFEELENYFGAALPEPES